MKEKIIKESTQLFFRHGIRSITMDDIAKEIGISKKTLYLHFENKNELLLSCMEANECEEKNILSSFQNLAKNAIDEMIMVASYVEQKLQKISPTLIYDVQKYHSSAWEQIHKMHYQEVYRVIQENLTKGIAEGLYRDDFNVDIVSKIYVQTSVMGINSDFFAPCQYDLAEVIKTNIFYHIHGVVSEKGLALLQSMKSKINLK